MKKIRVQLADYPDEWCDGFLLARDGDVGLVLTAGYDITKEAHEATGVSKPCHCLVFASPENTRNTKWRQNVDIKARHVFLNMSSKSVRDLTQNIKEVTALLPKSKRK